MKKLIFYFISFIIIGIILYIKGHININLLIVILSLIFYLNFKKDMKSLSWALNKKKDQD